MNSNYTNWFDYQINWLSIPIDFGIVYQLTIPIDSFFKLIGIVCFKQYHLKTTSVSQIIVWKSDKLNFLACFLVMYLLIPDNLLYIYMSTWHVHCYCRGANVRKGSDLGLEFLVRSGKFLLDSGSSQVCIIQDFCLLKRRRLPGDFLLLMFCRHTVSAPITSGTNKDDWSVDLFYGPTIEIEQNTRCIDTQHLNNAPWPWHPIFFFGFESTQLARQLHQERTQMEVQ